MTDETPNPLQPTSLVGRRVLVTGSSRGVGAATAQYFAEAGASVVINYRNKSARAEKIVRQISEAGGTAIALGADITSEESRDELFEGIKREFGGLDILVLNASGGMEADMGEDYALLLNRDAQVATMRQALTLMPAGGRVVFVTSHQAHFIRTTPTLPEYEPVALSKRAGEDALFEQLPLMTEHGVEFVVVSGDMIDGTITATMLNRLNPGAIEERRSQVGRLYTVAEFAAEVARAAVEPVPADHLRLIGDVSSFTES